MKILDYFKELTGITLHIKPSVAHNKIQIFCDKVGIKKDDLLNVLHSNPSIRQKFIDYLTTNETFFFREFHQIKEMISLIDKTKHIDILSLPSSSGEEAYSIAIALLEENFTNFKIVGIDINNEMIFKAKKGIYTKNKLRNFPPHLISKYFSVDNKYILNNQPKSFVTFKQLNLFDNAIYSIGKFDFIFCRNLFIYFDKETKNKAKNILEKLKKDNNSKIFFGHADLF